MKKALPLFLLLLLFLCCFSVCAADDTVILVGEDVSTQIVLPADASPQETYAARTLQTYLEKITGKLLPVTAQADAGRAFVLGSDPLLGEGAYALREENGTLAITGGGMRGTIYGVFAFLEQVCGCRYYTPGDFSIPQKAEICVPQGFTLDYAPYFEYTETDWRNGDDPVFTVANNISGGNICLTPDEMGGCIYYFHACYAHSLTTLFCSAETYFDTHPEYFALHDGKRCSWQLCLTNPDVLELVIREALEFLAENNDPARPLQILTISQNDNRDFCSCEACAALDAANGSHAGTMLTFVNSVADAVKAAGYDNVVIDTFAYEYTRQAPTAVAPRENVIVRLCPIECCYGHALDDPDCEANAAFLRDLQDWAKICKRIYIWDYGTNYSEYLSFFPNLHVLQRNIQVYYENNVKGLYGAGNQLLRLCDGEFGDLRLYLQAKLMQNPYLDFDSEMNGFLAFYYGDGWQSLREFLDFCCEKGVANGRHIDIYERTKGSLPGVKDKDVKRLDALWAQAEERAQTEIQKQRVRRSALCWRYWKCSNHRGEFSLLHTPIQRMKARDALYLDLVDSGITILGETNRKRALSDCYALHLLFIPFKWTTLYDSAFWDFISPAVVWYYHLFDQLS